MKHFKSILIVSLSLLSAMLIFSQCNLQNSEGEKHSSTHKEPPYLWPADEAVSQNLQQWQDWKFGVIIHWGPYSQWSIVESWSLCPEDEPWCERRGEFAHDYYTYVKEYQKIREIFNPTQFNPETWAKACHDAGMKYLVFTTKHHDGFCMYNSKHTDYKITDPGSIFSQHPKSNITKEIFDAFRSYNMGVGVYFSKADWHSKDYWWPYFPVFDRNVNYDPEKYPERWNRFKEFTYNQTEELMTDYGDVDILWLDGGWVRPAGTLTEETRPWLGKNQWVQDIDMPRIARMARDHQPGLLIVDRTVHGEFENYRTPEQQVPEKTLPYPWESCITLGDSWYSTGPKERYKSANWAIHTLVNIVAKGGNLLLGIGPDKTGAMVPEVYQRLKEIGEWIKINGEAIYNTIPLEPFNEGNYCYTQSKDGKKINIFYLINENGEIPDEIIIPFHFSSNIQQVELLGYNSNIRLQNSESKFYIEVPEEFKRKNISTPAVVVSVTKSN
jgi:alpha-L-fucosidase